jgi:acetoin utilization protein AcuB
MLVSDLMTRDVITVTRETPVLDALKIMKEHDFRRLPVIDDDGRPVGVVSERSIEALKPHSGVPMLWQAGPWAYKHSVGEVMKRKVVSVKPTDTVEYATAKAQNNKVGTLLVVEENKIVGVVTTNDIFYKVVNPTLGIGEPGTRLLINGGGEGRNTEKIIAAVNDLGVPIKIVWAVKSSDTQRCNLVLHLEVDDARSVVGELAKAGYDARIMNR